MIRNIKIEVKAEKKELAYLAGLVAATIGLLFSGPTTFMISPRIMSFSEEMSQP